MERGAGNEVQLTDAGFELGAKASGDDKSPDGSTETRRLIARRNRRRMILVAARIHGSSEPSSRPLSST